MNKKELAQAQAQELLQAAFAAYDSHTHLTDEAFNSDYGEVLERALAANVQRFMLPAWDYASTQAVFPFHASLSAKLQAAVVYAVGVHPHDAEEYFAKNAKQLISDLLNKAARTQDLATPKIRAIGEIGLDYYYDNSPRPVQQAAFKEQIALAHSYNLPLIIHSREAHADTLSILQAAQAEGLLAPLPGVIHCYSGSKEHAKRLLDLGFYLGFDGPLTYKNARQGPEVVAECPLERILVETDAPYLTPEPWRGKRNEPLYVKLVLQKIAEIKGLDVQTVAKQVYANSVELFGAS